MRVQDAAPERLGPYRLIRRLGEGGMGVVYLAVDEAGQQVAVKALHPGMAQEENARRRLAREVETMRRVRSRYVAEVLDADLDSAPPYIVTRYVPGLTLDAVVGAGGPLTGQALARLAGGLADALAAVHAAGVVHRDLKPGNVMICDGEPVVIDFGIASMPETTRLTLTGMFMGTPGYLAPEVIEGKESGPASDVHSWGATLAFAATGRPPFGTGTFEVIFYRIMHGEPDLDTLPAPLRPAVLAALSRDPFCRPSAADLTRRVAALDPESLIPSPSAPAGAPAPGGAADGAGGPAAGGPAVAFGALPRTVTDEPAWQPLPNSTRPLTSVGPDDVRDLLPPVSYERGAVLAQPGEPAAAAWDYQQAGYPPAGFAGRPPAWPGSAGPGSAWPGPAGPGGPAWPGPAESGPAWPGSGAPGTAGQAWPPAVRGEGQAPPSRAPLPVSAWSPLVLACVAMAVAAAMMAPIIGTAIALAVFVALRAAAVTARSLARRSADASRSGGRVVAVALYPLGVLRSLIGLVLLAPVALLGSCVAAAATIIIVPVHPLPRAVAFGAGALVAVVGLGPGSTGSRTVLASAFGNIARTPTRLTIAYVGFVAVAAWAGLAAWSQSQAPGFWPVSSLHGQIMHLPAIRTLLTDVRQNLLRLARQFGL